MSRTLKTPDFQDLNLRYKGHPMYSEPAIIQDDIVQVIVQKLEMILFTSKGDVFSQPTMGADLEFYLWQTTIANNDLKRTIIEQISIYVPELDTLGYTFELELFEGTVRDIMTLSFEIKGYNINYIFR